MLSVSAVDECLGARVELLGCGLGGSDEGMRSLVSGWAGFEIFLAGRLGVAAAMKLASGGHD